MLASSKHMLNATLPIYTYHINDSGLQPFATPSQGIHHSQRHWFCLKISLILPYLQLCFPQSVRAQSHQISHPLQGGCH